MSELNLVFNVFEQKELVISFFIFKILLLLYLGRRYYLRNRYLKTILEKESTYRYLFENGVDATLVSDKNGTIIMVNRQFEKLTGYGTGDVKGKRWDKIAMIINNDSENCEGKNGPVRNKFSVPSWCKSIIKNKSGKEFYCHTHIQNYKDKEYSIMTFMRTDSNGYHLEEKPKGKQRAN